MDIIGIEERILAEWNYVRATIALYPYWTVAAALIIGWLVGRLL